MGQPKVVLSRAEIDPRDGSIRCVDCGGRAILTTLREPNFNGVVRKVWYRVCKCGAHYGSNSAGKAMSLPADRRTRWLRARAHEEFDKLWQPITQEPKFLSWLEKTTRNTSRAAKRMVKTRRNNCYRWLAVRMGLPNPDAASIGQMNAAQCQNVIAICEDATWAQVEAWLEEQKDKKRGSSKPTSNRRKSKRRPARLLGSEEDEDESW